MSERDNGGPAFPQPLVDTRGPSGLVSAEEMQLGGMSLRDYFIAHAPAEPWPEFDPVMRPRPELPNKFTMLSDADRRDWDNDRLECDEDRCSEALRQFAAATTAARAARDDWAAERNLKRRIQWPAYWADQMIKARNA